MTDCSVISPSHQKPAAGRHLKKVWKKKSARRKEPFLKRFFLLAELSSIKTSEGPKLFHEPLRVKRFFLLAEPSPIKHQKAPNFFTSLCAWT